MGGLKGISFTRHSNGFLWTSKLTKSLLDSGFSSFGLWRALLHFWLCAWDLTYMAHNYWVPILKKYCFFIDTRLSLRTLYLSTLVWNLYNIQEYELYSLRQNSSSTCILSKLKFDKLAEVTFLCYTRPVRAIFTIAVKFNTMLYYSFISSIVVYSSQAINIRAFADQVNGFKVSAL